MIIASSSGEVAPDELSGADYLELRGLPVETIKRIQQSCPIPLILKAGSEIALFFALKPDFCDVDGQAEVPSDTNGVKVLRSTHNFDETPEDLQGLYDELTKKPADLYKIATYAKETTDALRLLKFAEGKKNLIAVAMGPFGQVSRILAPLFGLSYTYASLGEGRETAPGQLSLAHLIERYHYHELNEETKLYGLIGSPVHQSPSDVTHNAVLKDHHGVYVKMQVEREELGRFLDAARSLPFKGLSVTMPHKEAILPYLDSIDPEAEKIGAVNTLNFCQGKIRGYNTDGKGAFNALKMRVKGKKVLVLGAGGAARAACFEGIKRGAEVTLWNRSEERGKKVAEELGCGTKLEPPYDVILNCTPADPELGEGIIRKGTLVLDMRIRPQVTLFLKRALCKGARVVYGDEMFVHQAALQFNIWNG